MTEKAIISSTTPDMVEPPSSDHGLDNTVRLSIIALIWSSILETEAADGLSPDAAKVLASNIYDTIEDHIKG